MTYGEYQPELSNICRRMFSFRNKLRTWLRAKAWKLSPCSSSTEVIFIKNQTNKFPLKYLIGAIISNVKGRFPFEFEEFNCWKSFHIWNCQLSNFSYSNFHVFSCTHPIFMLHYLKLYSHLSIGLEVEFEILPSSSVC